MDLVQVFISKEFIFLSLGIWALTLVVRKITEFILDKPQVPASKTSRIWTDLILPLLPVFIGLVFGIFVKKYAYPESMISTSSRIVFAVVAGMFSGLVFRVVKSVLPKDSEVGVILNKLNAKDDGVL
jgi:hypothetical protein